MRSDIIARQDLLEKVDQCLSVQGAHFLAFYGRRRIGKTYFIDNYFDSESTQLLFKAIGTKNSAQKNQINHFMDKMEQAFGPIFETVTQNTKSVTQWQQAFSTLRKCLHAFMEQPLAPSKWVVIFIDELPWFDTKGSEFTSWLSNFWEEAKQYPNLVLAVCGSAAQWMIGQVVHASGGLHNRITESIRVNPFTLPQAREYLKLKFRVDISLPQAIELYLAIGGVAFYLDKYRVGESAAQFVARVLIDPGGGLHEEYLNLYKGLFKNYKQHLKIVEILGGLHHQSRLSGMSVSELQNVTSIPLTTLKDYLAELCAGQFIQAIDWANDNAKERYKLVDEFTLFYIHWLKTPKKRQQLSTFEDWQKARESAAWYSWSGYSFENIVFKHSALVKRALGVAAVKCLVYKFRVKGKPEQKGCEIDLVIERADGIGNLLQCKFSNEPYSISETYKNELLHSKQLWEMHSKKTGFITMVTLSGLRDNQHSRELNAVELTAENLFS